MSIHPRSPRAVTIALAVLVGAGAAVPAPAATQPTGRYIVSVWPVGSLGATAQELVGDRVEATLGGSTTFTARLTAREAGRLATNPIVAVVEPDRIVRISDTQRNPEWNLDRIDQHGKIGTHTYTPLSSASAVHAYVIDTGINMTHEEFGGRAVSGWSYRKGKPATDCNGHGTHVAGTIGGRTYGVAKGVQLVGVRVLDCEGSGWISDVIAGVNWVTAHAIKPAVANVSLGGEPSKALDAAVRRSIASGVTYAVAAGNENADACGSSPARVATAITVGATDARDIRASFSNFGRCLDIFAPGVSIVSAYKGSRNAGAMMDGTSMASPHVAGAAAMLLAARPALNPAQVANHITRNATAGRMRDAGRKSPNRMLFTTLPPAAATIATAALADATAGVAYRAKLSRTGALAGSWTLASGALPDGLRLSRAGVISGRPATAGTATFVVRFTDFVPRAANRELTITVNPAG